MDAQYVQMMEQLQREGAGSFSGCTDPSVADEWRERMEDIFQSLRCPDRYRVDLAVHYLSGDARVWWRSEAFDRMEARFLGLTQGDRTLVVVSPAARSEETLEQSILSKDRQLEQRCKKKRKEKTVANQGGQGCYGRGSTDHVSASGPRGGDSQEYRRVCYHCGEEGHIRPFCPKRRQMMEVAVQPKGGSGVHYGA
ncbi:PREDICTED: uncharacterized protein LOC104752459 [Camelina sativa]|uniref:Uncharacterized protein LOC104752459 n=1 Tax=Camelina sativa TaxID=90675 RepID=A0ABM0WLR6_CAMSA|nr:PREDICTED: uncharacterized protein LOC104752459 [Camelina sativa]